MEEESEIGKIKYQPTKQYSGILEYKKDDEAELIRRIVTGQYWSVY